MSEIKVEMSRWSKKDLLIELQKQVMNNARWVRVEERLPSEEKIYLAKWRFITGKNSLLQDLIGEIAFKWRDGNWCDVVGFPLGEDVEVIAWLDNVPEFNEKP